MNKNKKRILSGILALWIMGNLSYDHKVIPNYEIVDKKNYYANYSNGKVYIGKRKNIEKITDASENDILILDRRDEDDPNMQILSSYRIIDANIQNEILEIINEYEKEYPSSWNRSTNSMRVEWFIHNVLYYLNYNRERTTDVDFNNEDAKVYRKIIK